MILGGIGSNQVLETLGAQATISDNAAGGTLLIKALGGSSTVNVGDNSSIETVRLGGTASNTVNVGLGTGQLTVDGATGADMFNFAGTAPTITTVSKTEVLLAFAGGETVDIHAINHSALTAIETQWHFG